VGKIVFLRDTSGSIGPRQGSEHRFLVDMCLAETGCSGILADSDTEIKDESVVYLEPGDECPAYEHGGGGTEFAPALRWVQKLVEDGEDVTGLVFLTDGDCSDEEEVKEIGETYDIPTLWIWEGSIAGRLRCRSEEACSRRSKTNAFEAPKILSA